jgi:hypothetical protein
MTRALAHYFYFYLTHHLMTNIKYIVYILLGKQHVIVNRMCEKAVILYIQDLKQLQSEYVSKLTTQCVN